MGGRGPGGKRKTFFFFSIDFPKTTAPKKSNLKQIYAFSKDGPKTRVV
jgi:hypothetical protein